MPISVPDASIRFRSYLTARETELAGMKIYLPIPSPTWESEHAYAPHMATGSLRDTAGRHQ